MGEYTGRRRGRAASEPPAQEPEYPYVEESSYQQGYFADEYAQPQPQYGYEYAPEYTPEYTQDPAYGYQYQEAPAYEQQPSYEQYPSYEQQQPSYEQYPSYEQQQPSYEQYPSYEQQPSYEPAPHYDYGTNEPYPQQGYAEEYQAEYHDQGYQQEPYQETYQDSYQEPYYEQPYEEQQPYSDEYGTYESYDSQDSYASYEYEPSLEPLRPPLPLLSHLPFAGAATAALATASFVSVQAVAAVVIPLQLVVAWAILDLTGFRSRRTTAMAALPALAGVLGTFKFQPDDAVLPIAAGLGTGFVLIAADAVLRARRRGVEPGTVRALAAAATALLFAGLTGLFVPAAVLHSTSVAIGAVVCGVVSVTAARNPELGASRTAVVGIPVTVAALASYAAAILVP